MKIGLWGQVGLGFAAGIVALCVAAEIVMTTYKLGSTASFFAVVKWIGTFEWLKTYQELLVGIGAVIAAYFSIRAVRQQIEAAELASAKQIESAAAIEDARIEAMKAASRAALPLALSSIYEHAEEQAERLIALHSCVAGGALPKSQILQDFAPFPGEVVGSLKEVIQYSDAPDRKYMWDLLARIQIYRSRLSGLIKNHSNPSHIVTSGNIEAIIIDLAVIMSRASGLFKYARGASDHPPQFLSKGEIGTALAFIDLAGTVSDHLIHLYGLQGDLPWHD